MNISNIKIQWIKMNSKLRNNRKQKRKLRLELKTNKTKRTNDI